MGRAPNGSSSIYEGADGKWHTYVFVGHKPDGSLDRRHVKRGTATAAAARADELRDSMKRGNGTAVKPQTVAEWLTYWLDMVVEPHQAYKTTEDYRSLIRNHFIPHLGQWRLAGRRRRLEPEHVEAMYAAMARTVSSSYVAKGHRVLNSAMTAAVQRGHADRNVCALIKKPRSRPKKIQAHTLEQAQALLAAAVDDPRAARWLIGILLGPRQGEALGLRWPNVHLDAAEPFMRVEKQLQRRRWRHGCDDPAACAARRCQAKRCVAGYEHGCDPACGKHLAYACPKRRQTAECVRHIRACPKPCPPGCVRHAAACPQRAGGGLVEADVKSAKGERDVPLPPIVVDLLVQLREHQVRRAADFGRVWDPKGLVFVNQQGRPMDPRQDYEEWKRLLERAGIPHSRLHAARHDAATFLLASGTDSRVVQELLGHSRISVTEGYMDVAADLKRQAVNRIADTLLNGQLTTLLGAPGVPQQRR